jgi:hypothetical protein
MSNSLGTLSGALVAQEGLPLLLAKYPLIKNIVTDFSDEPVLFNQNVITRIPGVGTVQDYSTSTGYVPANATSTDVSITVNKHRHATFALTDQDISSTKRDLVGEYSYSFAKAMGEDLMSTIAALWISSNYSNTFAQAVSSATIANTISVANTALNTRNVDTQDRFGVFNAALYGAIRNDDRITYLTAGGVGVGAAQLPVIEGVTSTLYSALPSTGYLQGVVGTKDSVVLAARVPADSYEGLTFPGAITVVTDADSGLSVMVREWYDMGLGQRKVTFTWMFGVGVGNANSLELITTQ